MMFEDAIELCMGLLGLVFLVHGLRCAWQEWWRR